MSSRAAPAIRSVRWIRPGTTARSRHHFGSFAKRNLEHLEQPIRALTRQAIATGDAPLRLHERRFGARDGGPASALFDLPAHDYRELRTRPC
jgi:hypothetical protein